MKMFKAISVEAARRSMIEEFNSFQIGVEEVEIEESLDRYIAQDIESEINVPHFRRSTVDGYALISRDTYGASESLPAFLQVIEKVEMGKQPHKHIEEDKAIYVPTGGMIPHGADSVVMVEYVENLDDENIAVYSSTAPKENVIDIGDDINKDSKVLSKGMKIRPQDVGVLASIGISRVKVFKKPRFVVISTGDEIVSPEEEAKPGQIKDINTYTLSAMIEKAGGIVTKRYVVNDNFQKLKEILEESIDNNEMVVLSGGSSVGTKDISAKVINSLGEPGVFVHGVAIKPGKPTILAKINDKPIFGLPGQPTSAMIVFKVFVEYFLNHLFHNNDISSFIEAESSVNIHSAQGKETYQMVTIEKENDKYIAYPVYGKSGMITLMSKAKGYIKINTDREGIKQGEKIKVYNF